MAEKKIKVTCEKCSNNTNHSILKEEIISEHSEELGIQYWEKYQIIKCDGCETISFCKTTGNSEDFDPNTNEWHATHELYSKNAKNKLYLRDDEYLPPEISRIHYEMNKAFNAEMLLLSTVGLRMLIEALCIDKKIKGKNLFEKINELEYQGFLTKNQKDYLHELRFLGNLAAHEIKAPETHILLDAIDIAETLLKTIYVLPEKSKRIKK